MILSFTISLPDFYIQEGREGGIYVFSDPLPRPTPCGRSRRQHYQTRQYREIANYGFCNLWLVIHQTTPSVVALIDNTQYWNCVKHQCSYLNFYLNSLPLTFTPFSPDNRRLCTHHMLKLRCKYTSINSGIPQNKTQPKCIPSPYISSQNTMVKRLLSSNGS